MVNDDERSDEVAREDAEPAVRPAPQPRERPQASRRTVAREERRRRSSRKGSRRRLFYGLGGGVIALMLITGLVLPSVGNLGGTRSAADPPDDPPLSGTEVSIQQGGIIEVGAAHDAYSTQPPSSGPRYADPAPWGVHAEKIDDETVVRNLEVGGVVFNYNLDVEEEITDLRQFVEAQPGYPGCYLLHPNESVPTGSVTLTSWGRTQQIDGIDRFLMQTFADDNLNQAPQYIDPSCGGTPEEATAPEADEPHEHESDEPHDHDPDES